MKLIGAKMAAAAALLTILGGTQAQAGPCTTGSVATYTAPGFTCDVGTLEFSGFTVQTSGLVTLGNFQPVVNLLGPNNQLENGFELGYAAFAGPSPGGALADVLINYTVSVLPGGPLIEDAYMSLTGGTGGDSAVITLDETLSPNGVHMHLTGAGVTDTTFPTIGQLFAVKDQEDFSGLTFSDSSSVIDAFSQCIPGAPNCVLNPPTTVPEPSSMIILGSALVGLGALARRRRRKAETAAA